MGPSAQKHSLDDFNADNFGHSGHGFIRGAQISVGPADLEGGPIGAAAEHDPPPGTPLGGGLSRFHLEVFRASRCARRANRKPALRGSDHRPRSGCSRSVWFARASINLRLAARPNGPRASKISRAKAGNNQPLWVRRTCGVLRSAQARRERTTKAGRAWAPIPRPPW